MRDALRLSFGTLTAFPVAPPRRVERDVAGRAMLLAFLPGMALAAPVGALAWLGVWVGVAPLVLAVGLVALLVLSTRAMHLDGLADTTDGLSVPFDRDRALRAMKASDTGPSGVASITLALLGQVAGWTVLLATPRGWVLGVLAVVFSRQLLALGAALVPAARPDGLGAFMASTVRPPWAWMSVLLTAAVGLLVVWLAGSPVVPGVVGIGAAVLACLWLLRRSRDRFGGITGDVLGATIEAGYTVAVLAAAAAL